MAATTAMIIGAAAAGAQAIGSIAQAQKQKKLQEEAEVETAKALAKAEDLIVTEFQEGVQLPLEAYELEAQTNIANQRQLVESLGGAGQRALIGGVGRVGATGAMASESARLKMQKDQYLRDNAIATERTGIRNKLVGLEEGKITGAQQAAADAEYRRMMAQQQAMQAIGKGVQYGFGAADLYTGMRDKSPTQTVVDPTQTVGTKSTESGDNNNMYNPDGSLNFGNNMYNPDGSLNFGNNMYNPDGSLNFGND